MTETVIRDGARFAVAGTLNATLTSVIYVAALLLVTPTSAYALAGSENTVRI